MGNPAVAEGRRLSFWQVTEDSGNLLIFYSPSILKQSFSSMASKRNTAQIIENNNVIDVVCSKIKDEDYSHRGFLKPIQIALKTYQTEMMTDTKLTHNSLPAGLKIAVKSSINDNKFTLHDVKQIEKNQSLAEIQQGNQDNMLALMKQMDGIELAICICMYSEEKKMLKSTIAGVAENVSNLVLYQKMDPDKIGVFVLMDGIEKVDPNVVDYFEQLERSNNINLGDNIAPSMSMEEMSKRAQSMTPQEMNQMDMKNINNFLFSVAELQDRNQRRFCSVRKEYDEIKKLYANIQTLKKGKPIFDDLPNKLRPFFMNEAREQRKKEYSMSDDEVKQLSDDRLIEEYASDVRRAKPLIIKCLQEGERYCTEYVSSREDLAYLGCFRHKIKLNYQGALCHKEKRHRNKEYTDIYTNEVFVEEVVEGPPPTSFMNLFMCIKYKNSGKLSSHNWFFNGFCKELKPRFAVLLDVGLRPDQVALYKMYTYMKSHLKVGGVCGYMSLKIEQLEDGEEVQDDQVDFVTAISLKFADIQRTQQVEYHFAHLMDKCFEASFGFIHVLPGAFSAYNMNAIVKYDGDQEDDVLLKSYFKSIDEKLATSRIEKSDLSLGSVMARILLPNFINGCFIKINKDSEEQMLYNENIYLAEDRILCMGIHKKGFDMAFLPDAYAEVDPIKTVHGLLGQRKRWINGSFFAFEKVKEELAEHEKLNGLELFLHFQMLYLTLLNSLSYFAPAFFLFTVHIAMEAFREDVIVNFLGNAIANPETSEFYNAFIYTMDFIYVMLILSIVFFSLHLTNNNKKFKPYVYLVSTCFGLFAIIVFLVLAVDIIRGLADGAAFLVRNTSLIDRIPGGLTTIDIMRWILIGSTVIYIVPIFTYLILFRKSHVLWEIVMGAFSFIFYGPTYLNILNIYSLCRIDDISWGTKGLDSGAGGGKNAGLKDSWRLIKFIHVSKYVIWNIVLSVTLLSLGSSYQARFFITIIMVVMMAGTLSLKIVIGIIYMITYKISDARCCKDQKIPKITPGESRIKKIVDSYREEIEMEIRNYLNDAAEEYKKNDFQKFGGSFVQATRTKRNIDKSLKKHSEQAFNRSKIEKPKNKAYHANHALLPSITEQKEKEIPIAAKKVIVPSWQERTERKKDSTLEALDSKDLRSSNDIKSEKKIERSNLRSERKLDMLSDDKVDFSNLRQAKNVKVQKRSELKSETKNFSSEGLNMNNLRSGRELMGDEDAAVEVNNLRSGKDLKSNKELTPSKKHIKKSLI